MVVLSLMVVVVVVIMMMIYDMAVKMFTVCSLYCCAESGTGCPDGHTAMQSSAVEAAVVSYQCLTPSQPLQFSQGGTHCKAYS